MKELFFLILSCAFFFPAIYYIAVTDPAPMWVIGSFPVSVFFGMVTGSYATD